MMILSWLLAGAIATVITGWSIFNKSKEITVSEAGGLTLLFASGFVGLAMVVIMSVIFFFENYGDEPLYKQKPKPEPITKQVNLNGLYNVPVDAKGDPLCTKIEKCEHEQPCYRPECKS